MAVTSVQKGNVVRLSATFKDVNSTNTDPTTIAIKIGTQDGTTTTVTYPTGIQRTGAGVYYYDYTASIAGWISYCWVGTGTLVATGQATFLVTDTLA